MEARSVRKGPEALAPLSRSLSVRAAATGNSQECASEINGRSARSARAPKEDAAGAQSEKDEASRAEVARVQYWNALPEAISVRCPPLLLSSSHSFALAPSLSSFPSRERRFLGFLLPLEPRHGKAALDADLAAPAEALLADSFPAASIGIFEIILRLRHEPSIPRAARLANAPKGSRDVLRVGAQHSEIILINVEKFRGTVTPSEIPSTFHYSLLSEHSRRDSSNHFLHASLYKVGMEIPRYSICKTPLNLFFVQLQIYIHRYL